MSVGMIFSLNPRCVVCILVFKHQNQLWLTWWVSYENMAKVLKSPKVFADLWLLVSKTKKIESSKRHNTAKSPLKFRGISIAYFSDGLMESWNKNKHNFDGKFCF